VISKKLAEQEAAFEGRRGGLLVAVSPADGKPVAAYRLHSMPVFDGMIAANGRLYLATRDGNVMCLGAETGKPLPAAPNVKVKARPPDPVLKQEAVKPAPKMGLPSAAADFAEVRGAWVWRTKDGYRVANAEGSRAGVVLKKLPSAVTGKVTFQTKIRANSAPQLHRGRVDGYLVFGDTPDTPNLVFCGVMVRAKRALITEGAGKNANQSRQSVAADFSKEQEIVVTVDVPAGTVEMTAAGKTVSLKLKRDLKCIAYVGYCVQSAVSDFTPVTEAGKARGGGAP